ncbi:transcriptional enhancer factor TEF-3 isoform X2 [Pteropus vampyrus]|uniref:Transcriptional enhancer factor TEF-3 isoform X2 n=1 Tax=Pteropus vampyrus TaxID=132908 RepID=A0A6P6CU89_PTEVA|nr:transcriptional enhancer factor TEF-3 isoform X2 [Pteropus vampyrus]
MACLVAELLMLQQGKGSCGAGWGSLKKRDGSSGMSGVRVSADGGHRPPQPPQRKQHCTVGVRGTRGLPIHWASSLCQVLCHVQWLSQDSNQLVLDLLVDDVGRNELIARYIKLRTGKTRTRKQVSSHIQVLARRKAREIQAKLKFWQGALPGQAGTSHDVKPFSQQSYTVQPSLPLPGFESPAGPAPSPSAPPAPPWQGRSVASSKLWMLEFSAFLEQQQDPDTYNKHLFVHIGQSSPSYSDPYLEAVDIRQIYDKFPEKKGGLKELFERGPSNAFFLVKFWADLNTNMEDEGSSFYGVSSQYESPENMIITCSTKVCSFGKQVVEKVETEYARYENGHYSYRIHRSPLCEYMINFIHKLKHLPEKYMMNSVLENFTILQVVTNRDTQETLLCIAYVFEVSASEHGAQHHIYRLVKD